MKIKGNFERGEPVELGAESEGGAVESYGVAHKAYPGVGGRIITVPAGSMNASDGIMKPRADGKVLLDLRSERDPGEVLMDIPGDRLGVVNVRPQQQRDGWGNGDHYWLETDAQGRFVIEPGRRHRKFYISASPATMSKAQIAAEAGVAESVVTGPWLLSNLEYGTEAKPIDIDLASEAYRDLYHPWYAYFQSTKVGRSDWWLYERGYTYPKLAASGTGAIGFDAPAAGGESPLHPMFIGAWGTGHKPKFEQGIFWKAAGPSFTVMRDLHCHVFVMRTGRMLALEGCESHGPDGGDAEMTDFYLITLKDTELAFGWKTAPSVLTLEGRWAASPNRGGGLYSDGAYGLMVHGNLAYHGGWADGFSYDAMGDTPMPPSQFSHGFYIADTSRNVTSRYNLLIENASFGAMYRPGAFAHDNLYIDNNIPCNDLGSEYKGRGPIGQYALHLDNLATSSAYKQVIEDDGAYNWGFRFEGRQISRVGNIICHMSDPNDPDDIARKNEKNYGILFPQEPEPYFDDTIEYRWGHHNHNIEGLNTAVLDQTTIQNYARDELALTPPTIRELSLSCLGADIPALAKDIIKYFRQSFEVYVEPRADSAAITFLPDDRGEGFRWDNRLNWTTTDLPGVVHRDSVDLGGHVVKFGTITAHVSSVTGTTERLQVTSGKLTADTFDGKAEVAICGQLHVGGGNIDAIVRGGRFAVTGTTSGSIAAYDMSEVLLGPDFTVATGDRLEVQGDVCNVGWDGAGSPQLSIEGTLAFRPALKCAIPGRIQSELRYLSYQFRDKVIGTGSISGATFEVGQPLGYAPVHTVLYNITGEPVEGDSWVYFTHEHVEDEKDGIGYYYDPDTDSSPNPHKRTLTDYTATLESLGTASLPALRRFKRSGDDAEPTCTPTVTLAAGSTVDVMDEDRWPIGTHYLTAAGITVTDNGANLSSGVSIIGGRLAYTKT